MLVASKFNYDLYDLKYLFRTIFRNIAVMQYKESLLFFHVILSLRIMINDIMVPMKYNPLPFQLQEGSNRREVCALAMPQ